MTKNLTGYKILKMRHFLLLIISKCRMKWTKGTHRVILSLHLKGATLWQINYQVRIIWMASIINIAKCNTSCHNKRLQKINWHPGQHMIRKTIWTCTNYLGLILKRIYFRTNKIQKLMQISQKFLIIVLKKV